VSRIYRFTLSIGLSNAGQEDEVDVPAEYGISDDEWDAMPEAERNEKLEQAWKDWAWNFIDGGYDLKEPNNA
jgi:hypothetical protein